jgi:hypothetical protein
MAQINSAPDLPGKSSDTLFEKCSKVLKEMTRGGSLYCPDIKSRMTISRSDSPASAAPGASRSFEAVKHEVKILVADIRHNRGCPRALTHTGTPTQLSAVQSCMRSFVPIVGNIRRSPSSAPESVNYISAR